MADKLQTQLQKRATNPFVKSWSGALRMVGVQPDGYNPDVFPAFEVAYSAATQTADIKLTKGARADYDILKYYAIGPNGNKIQVAADLNGKATLDLSGLDTSFVPGGVYVVSIGVVFRSTRGTSLNDGRRVLDYNFQVSPGTLSGDFVVDTLDRFDSDDRGAQIDISAVYSTGPDQVVVSLASPALAGLTLDIAENGSSIGSVTLDANGNGSLTNAGTLAAGDYTYVAQVTSTGGNFGTKNDVTITVV